MWEHRASHQDSPTFAATFFSLDSLGAGAAASELFSIVSDLGAVVELFEFFESRLSFTYQPEPLKTMPTGCTTRRIAPLHSGQTVSGSSANFWKKSNECPQSEQR